MDGVKLKCETVVLILKAGSPRVSAGVCRLAAEPADGPVQPSQTEVSQRCPPTGPPEGRLRGMDTERNFIQYTTYFHSSIINTIDLRFDYTLLSEYCLVSMPSENHLQSDSFFC